MKRIECLNHIYGWMVKNPQTVLLKFKDQEFNKELGENTFTSYWRDYKDLYKNSFLNESRVKELFVELYLFSEVREALEELPKNEQFEITKEYYDEKINLEEYIEKMKKVCNSVKVIYKTNC